MNHTELQKQIADTIKQLNWLRQNPRVTSETLFKIKENLEKMIEWLREGPEQV